MDNNLTSPAPGLSPTPTVKSNEMSFPDAIKELINGKRITRTVWNDINDINEYGILADGWLTIHTKGAFHKWLVNDGDLMGTDWKVI